MVPEPQPQLQLHRRQGQRQQQRRRQSSSPCSCFVRNPLSISAGHGCVIHIQSNKVTDAFRLESTADMARWRSQLSIGLARNQAQHHERRHQQQQQWSHHKAQRTESRSSMTMTMLRPNHHAHGDVVWPWPCFACADADADADADESYVATVRSATPAAAAAGRSCSIAIPAAWLAGRSNNNSTRLEYCSQRHASDIYDPRARIRADASASCMHLRRHRNLKGLARAKVARHYRLI